MAEAASAEQEPEALRLKRLRGGGYFTVPAGQRVSADYSSQEPRARPLARSRASPPNHLPWRGRGAPKPRGTAAPCAARTHRRSALRPGPGGEKRARTGLAWPAAECRAVPWE